MESEREISIDMAEDEWSAIMNAPDAAEAHNLSAAARAAVWSAAPHTKISKRLNAEGLRSPRGNGWTGSCVRAILRQPLYVGKLVWNRSQKVMRKGTKGQRVRPMTDWFEKSMPGLRIIDDATEARVQQRLADAGAAFARQIKGKFFARAGRLDGESPYLLTGHLICAECRGALGGRTQLHGRGPASHRTRHEFYHCLTHARRGPTCCTNRHVLKADVMDTAILKALQKIVTPDIVEQAVQRALAILTENQASLDAERAAIVQQITQVETRLGRLVSAITAGGNLDTLVEQLKVEEQQQKTLRATRAQIDAARTVSPLDVNQIRSDVRALASDILTVLREERTPQTRAMFRKLLPKPIEATPVTIKGQKGYRLNGRVSFASFLKGGVLHAIQPEQPDGGGPNGIRTLVGQNLTFQINGVATR